MAMVAEVHVQVERDGWEVVLRRFGFDPMEVGDAMAAAARRDAPTMLCVGLVAGSLHEQNISAEVERLTEGDDDGG